jgi:Tol biopolymer transport system component
MATSDGPHNLFVVHPDGTELSQVTSSEQDRRFSFGPVWSPDSTKLLFVRGLGDFDDTNLWIANADGTELQQITDSPGGYGGYAWVPSVG